VRRSTRFRGAGVVRRGAWTTLFPNCAQNQPPVAGFRISKRRSGTSKVPRTTRNSYAHQTPRGPGGGAHRADPPRPRPAPVLLEPSRGTGITYRAAVTAPKPPRRHALAAACSDYDSGVQLGKVAQIEREWKAAGEPYCEHRRYDKEYYLGADTGDLVCLTCGETWPRGEPVPPPRGVGQATD
jgi:hypothetical protein